MESSNTNESVSQDDRKLFKRHIWSKRDDKCLIEIAKHFSYSHWRSVADAFNNIRMPEVPVSAKSCNFR
jgi:hypothetical protein